MATAAGKFLERAGATARARSGITALACGGLAACGFEPLHWWPLTLIGVALLVDVVARAASWRRAALAGWLWGLAHFSVALNWIAAAFTYQAKMPGWLGWVAVVCLAAYLALFPALACLGAWWFRRREGALVLAFAGAWIISEALRGWVCTGFPWDPLGAALLGDFGNSGLAGLVVVCGAYGLSAVVVLIAAALRELTGPLIRSPRGEWRLAAGFLASSAVLALHSPAAEPPGTIPFTIVQPDIAQSVFDDPAHFPAQFGETARAMGPQSGPPRLILWPEQGTQDLLRDGYPAWAYQDTYGGHAAAARAHTAALLGPGSVLLTGAEDLIPARDGSRILAGRNVATALDSGGHIVGSYAKAHLVPYGEYLPLRPLLTPLGLARLVPGDIDLRPGPGPQTLDLGRFGKAGVQICYEIIFSGQVVDEAHRPDYLVNPTNDGWFGAWGPPQHLAQARLRAIEEGLPVLRPTVSGISAVIDADGRVLQFLSRGQAGHISGLIPPTHPPTFFARHGNAVPLCLAIAMLAFAALALRRAAR